MEASKIECFDESFERWAVVSAIFPACCPLPTLLYSRTLLLRDADGEVRRFEFLSFQQKQGLKRRIKIID